MLALYVVNMANHELLSVCKLNARTANLSLLSMATCKLVANTRLELGATNNCE